ncbi:MAG: site-2 protease family protein [Chloroflexi bacterium]|nr:site-2 protease family protein [Chloroflexota bacterium]
MLLRYLSVLKSAPEAFLILIAAFLVSMLLGLALHEAAHAFVGDRMGDRTPRRAGRLTLNPRAHLDPIGSALILFVGFGWARPVPVNPNAVANPRVYMVLVSAAGPLTNLTIAGLAGLAIKSGTVSFFHPFISPELADVATEVWTSSATNLLGLFLGTIVLLNVQLAVFNLLPLAPLDGFRVATGLLPPEIGRVVARYEAWGPGVLLLLFLVPYLTQGEYNPLFTVMSPLIDFFLRLFAESSGGVRAA